MITNLAYLGLIILCLPIAAFAILALFHNLIPRHGDWLATGAMGAALCLAVYILFQVSSGARDYNHDPARLTYDWLTLDRADSPGKAAGGGAAASAIEAAMQAGKDNKDPKDPKDAKDAARDYEKNAGAAKAPHGIAPSGGVVIGLQIDNLTAVMLLVVTLVSFVVQLFSIGYMHGDSKYGRFFASLSMFTASMLGLVLSDNLLTLYISWEIMGLASYILIGHFLHKPSANNASLKAFITTRVGDVGMFIGIMALYWQVGSFRFDDIFAAVADGRLTGSLRFWAALGLFFGAMGKSAQFPLHVWLPDAMEGPTPVSALIHAATMVAAGVYLVGRSYVLFPVEALLVVAYIGAITAVMAATIAIVQTDIKKVLAYSTVSQLGYMMIGLGCYGYSAGLGHLTTHAFFKACLFLGSGSVIYAMHHHQEMDKYGGLWRKLPVTFATFLIATLALTGFPWVFSGFHTKDAIIAKATEFGMIMGGFHQILGPLATVAALLTSFYMFRLIFLTFFGKPKDHHLFEHAKESPWTMVTPLVMLAALSFWYVGGPARLLGGRNVVKDMLAMPEQKEREIEKYVEQQIEMRGQGSGVRGQEVRTDSRKPKTENTQETENRKPKTENLQETENRKLKTENHLSHIEHAAHIRAVGGSLIVFPLGVLIAMAFYLFGWLNPAVWAAKLRPAYVFLCELWYIDHFYRIIFVRPFMLLYQFLGAFDKYVIDGVVYAIQWIVWLKSVIIGVFDNWGIDGMFNGGAWMTRFSGRVLAKAQSGRLRAYLLSIMLGVLALAIILFAIK